MNEWIFLLFSFSKNQVSLSEVWRHLRDMTPWRRFKFNWRFGRTFRLHLQIEQQAKHEAGSKPLLATCFLLVSCCACYLLHVSFLFGLPFDPEDEVICSSGTSAYFQRTTWRYIPEDRTLHSHHCENLKSYILRHLLSNTLILWPLIVRNQVLYPQKTIAKVSLVYFCLFVFARRRYMKEADLKSSKHPPNLNCY
jgi:hypothetical protein